MDQKEIEKTAQQIMDNFLEAMKDIEVEEDFINRYDQCLREEKSGIDTNEEFKQQFLNNAPQTKGDAIITEKGAWK